jgi:hypothetical protein
MPLPWSLSSVFRAGASICAMLRIKVTVKNSQSDLLYARLIATSRVSMPDRDWTGPDAACVIPLPAPMDSALRFA